MTWGFGLPGVLRAQQDAQAAAPAPTPATPQAGQEAESNKNLAAHHLIAHPGGLEELEADLDERAHGYRRSRPHSGFEFPGADCLDRYLIQTLSQPR